MKFVLLLAAGAFAAQDVTPPVISLTMPWVTQATNDWDYSQNTVSTSAPYAGQQWESTDTAHRANHEVHDLPAWVQAEHSATNTARTNKVSMNKRAAVTCVVQQVLQDGTFAPEQKCPDPVCSVTDHHDGTTSCNAPQVIMITKSDADSNSVTNGGAAAYTGATAHAWQGNDRAGSETNGARTLLLQNADVTTTPTQLCTTNGNDAATKTCVSRSVLGQYLVTYTASDSSNNVAEPVAFSFIFIDPKVPDLNLQSSYFETGYLREMNGRPDPAGNFITNTAHGAVWSEGKVSVISDSNTWGAVGSSWYDTTLSPTTHTAATIAGQTFPSSDTSDNLGVAAQAGASRNGAVVYDDNFEAGACDERFGGRVTNSSGVEHAGALSGCTRSAGGKWAFHSELTAFTASDNYRAMATASTTGMVVKYRYSEANTGIANTDAWADVSTAASGEICMTHGKTITFDFYTDDEAGIFGYKHTDNPQTHRVQFKVTDNTRPTIHPIKHNTNSVDIVSDERATATSYTDVANGYLESGGKFTTAYECVNPTMAGGGGYSDNCKTSVTLNACNAKKRQHGCTYTRTRNAWGFANDCESRGAVGFGTGTDECKESGSGCVVHEQRVFQSNANGVPSWPAGTKKCRAATTLSRTETAGVSTWTTSVSNVNEATTTYLECGRLTESSTVRLLEAYTEQGFTTLDNNDNLDDTTCLHEENKCTFPSGTSSGIQAGTRTSDKTAGECFVDNSAFHVAGASDYNVKNQLVSTDQTVKYWHSDAANNVADPVARRVVVQDTVPPTLLLDGDCSIQNSAGANMQGWHNDTSDYADQNAPGNDAHGLFDHDGVARFFRHSDHCDRQVVTTVALYAAGTGTTSVCKWADHAGSAVNEATAAGHNEAWDTSRSLTQAGRCHVNPADPVQTAAKRLPCVADSTTGSTHSNCYLGVFQWGGVDGAAGEKPAGESDNKLFTTGYSDNHQKFREYQAGTYAVVYQTRDASGNMQAACREIVNVDHTYPIIQILGSDQMTLEATHQGNYIDDGATCSDQVDGVISQNVEVSGDVVNLSKVGTYTITYNCKDSANNAAPAATRTVVVAQTSCPKCTIAGTGAVTNSHNIVHEASFPYTDPGASCSDVIDGDVSTLCFTSYAKCASGTSCQQGKNTDDTLPTVTLGADEAGLTAGQWLTGASGNPYGFCDSNVAADHSTCNAITTLNACWTTAGCRVNVNTACDSQDLINVGGTPTDTAGYKGAELGTYVITYRAKNTVGLYNDGANCRGGAQYYSRTVTVLDTLKPVITLKYNGNTVAQGTPGNEGLATETKDFTSGYHGAELSGSNPNRGSLSTGSHYNDVNFGDFGSGVSHHDGASGGLTLTGHPAGPLMSEDSTSSVNGWVVGAIASAVAGLALLGYSTRRTAVATSVPV